MCWIQSFLRFVLYSFVYVLDSKFFKICLVPVGFILEAQVRLALEVGFKGRDIFLNGCGKQHIVVLHFDLYKKRQQFIFLIIFELRQARLGVGASD